MLNLSVFDFSKETQNVLLDALKEMQLKSAKTNKKYLGKHIMILGRLSLVVRCIFSRSFVNGNTWNRLSRKHGKGRVAVGRLA